MRKTVIFVAVVVGVLAVGSGARGQTSKDDQAKVQYQQGIELFESGKFEQAAIAFRKAYDLKPSYKVLFNLAQAENSADRFAAALWAYTRYLAEGGADVPAERVKQVKEEITRLNALVGMVVIQGGPDGAEVFVDKESLGRTPLQAPLFVDLGRREVVVEQGGRRILERVVTVAGGERVVLELETSAAETGSTTPAPEPSPAGEEDEAGPKRLWTWVAAGVGGAALVGAVITGGMAISKKKDLDDTCPDGACPSSEMGEVDSARNLGNASTALAIIAGVGIAAGVVLFFVEPGLGEEQPSVEVGLGPLPGGGAVTLGRRF